MSGASLGNNGRAAPQVQQPRRSKVLLRVLVAGVAGAVTFLLSGLLNQEDDNLWEWTMSIVLGCAVLIVQYLVDFGERFEKVDQGFAEILSATELFSQVDGSVLRSEEVTRLVLGYTKVREQGGDIVQSFAEKELGRLAKMMEGLGSGSADCPGENHEWLIDITDCVKMTLDATSTSVDREFWTSGPADRYLAAQEKAIKRRGVEIRRLFIVRTEDEVTPELRALCDDHRRRGIDARIAVRALMESNPRVSDFIVFDGELCHETKPDQENNPDSTLLSTDPDHIEDHITQFTELWAEAERQTTPRVTSET